MVLNAAKLPALVYDPLPSAIGSRKLSANKQFFVGAQTVVSLLQTTQIKRVIYSHQQSLHQHKQNHNCLNRDGTPSLFLPRVDAPHVYVCALVLSCF